MREIVLDTETTGFEPSEGDRIVEIGCVELLNHMPTGRTFHVYVNPERDMPPGAFEVHGIGPDILVPPRPAEPGEVTLKDKPKFNGVGSDFLKFVGDANLVIHNAAFDMKFLNFELQRMGLAQIPWDRAVDTLAMARKKFPGAPASLDALCRRFGVDNSGRDKHGALLDSEILAEVYLELIGGRQPGLELASDGSRASSGPSGTTWRATPRSKTLPNRITDTETAEHETMRQRLGDNSVWSRLG